MVNPTMAVLIIADVLVMVNPTMAVLIIADVLVMVNPPMAVLIIADVLVMVNPPMAVLIIADVLVIAVTTTIASIVRTQGGHCGHGCGGDGHEANIRGHNCDTRLLYIIGVGIRIESRK